jgi:UDP-glucose 4-epimerase
MSMTERVLVTGGAGYIGSHVALALIDAGHRAVVLDDLSTGVRDLVPAEAGFVEGDAGDGTLLARVLEDQGITAVMHFAGSIIVPESVEDPLKYYRNNTCASRNLIEACVKARVDRFVFSSTAAVYGLPEALPAREDAPTAPINPYGASKLVTEMILADVARAHRLRYVALRYFNVAGADPKGRSGQSSPEATHLIKIACEVATGARGHIDIFGDDYETPDGTCIRDYIHVSDLATAHLHALDHLASDGESLTLNCGYGRGYSVREVLEAVERAAGARLEKRLAPRRAGDPPALVADATRIRERFDWRPEHEDLDAITASALAWERRRTG